jgi:hypothetical protein
MHTSVLVTHGVACQYANMLHPVAGLKPSACHIINLHHEFLTAAASCTTATLYDTAGKAAWRIRK